MMSLKKSLSSPISIPEVLKDHEKDDDCKPCIKPPVWDCESQLYDSYELRTFNKQLSAAMVAVSSRLTSPCHIMQSPVYAQSLASFLATARGDKPRRKSQQQGRRKVQQKQNGGVVKDGDNMLTVWPRKASEEDETYIKNCKQEGLQRKEKKKPKFVRLVKKLIL
ncbi:hypothetical protein SUGI_0551120 [Cryptomeria japonica]|nr:hypothetical protein SUGI_0551120 [Cryptomeria japonica]